MGREIIYTDQAPNPGNYSQGVKFDVGTGFMIYTSAQAADFPAHMIRIDLDGMGDIGTQTNRVLSNLQAIVKAGGGSLGDIVRVNVGIIDPTKNWDGFDAAYKQFFAGQEVLPTRSPITASELPWDDVMIMMDAVAYVPKPARAPKKRTGGTTHISVA